MRKGFSLLFLLITHQLVAQIDTVEVTEAESKKLRYQRRALFVGTAYDLTPVFDNLEPAIALSAGIQYQNFLFGVIWTDFDVQVQQQIIFPNFFDLRYRHAGFFGGYQFWHTKKLSADFIVQYSMGDAVWTSVGTGEDTFRDEFSFLTPLAQLNYTPTRFLWIFLGAGYRQALGVELAATEASDLSGLNVNFGLKMGFFWDKSPLKISDETN